MKTKSSVVLFPVCSALLFCVLSCSTPQKTKAENVQEIIDADKAMSALAQKEGFYRSLSVYADPGFVKLDDGSFPVIGKKTFDEKFLNGNDVKTISWEPRQAEVAASGELGYTWGNWKFTPPDTTYYGNYFTVWKKQPDGSWKIALDGGNSTPAPQ